MAKAMAVVGNLITDCSGEEHHVPNPAYGNAGSELVRYASGRVRLIGDGFVGIASSRNAPCA
jgi:hypothetical protein